MENFWDFSVWGGFMLVSVLLLSLLAANAIKNAIPLLRVSLIPTSVLGGVLLLLIAGIYKAITGQVMFDTALFGGNGTANLEIITYHTLALGFIASTFKASKGKLNKHRTVEIINTGTTTVSTYLLQAVVGFAITIIAALVMDNFFPAAGVLLPFGYGQGTGQAMNYGNIYETQFGFAGGKTFGLTVAAMGFLSASIGGVLHLIYLRRVKKISGKKEKDETLLLSQIQSENEIPMQGSMDKLTVQLALVAVAYLVAYGLMVLLGRVLPGMKAVIYGFNFLLGVLSATLIKWIMNLLTRCSIIKKQYASDFLMTRCSNFFFDIMVVAGIAAIRLDMLQKYWGILLVLGVVGLVITYGYNRLVAKTLFPDYAEEQFLTMYGMLTGTASTGIILLREIDNNFETPAADNLVYQNFPAIVLGFPMMFLATIAPQKPMFTLIVLFAFFVVLNLFLFRSKIFSKKNKKNQK